MVKVQTGSYKWMAVAIIFPRLLGLSVASAAHSIGNAVGATGIAAMSAVYWGAVVLLLIVGLFSDRKASPLLRQRFSAG